MNSLIDAFLRTIHGLEAEAGAGWTYYLNVLDAVEHHRAELRHAAWPDGFDRPRADTYRMMLLHVEAELRKMLVTVPRITDERASNEALVGFNRVLAAFMDRAGSMSDELRAARSH